MSGSLYTHTGAPPARLFPLFRVLALTLQRAPPHRIKQVRHMAKKFDDIAVDDQLEMTACRGSVIYGTGKDINPDAVVRVAIVTHIWFDPVEAKEYVALAYLRRNGSYGKPIEKRTKTGLARTGWQHAGKNWIAHLEAIEASGGLVVGLFDKRVR